MTVHSFPLGKVMKMGLYLPVWKAVARINNRVIICSWPMFMLLIQSFLVHD